MFAVAYSEYGSPKEEQYRDAFQRITRGEKLTPNEQRGLFGVSHYSYSEQLYKLELDSRLQVVDYIINLEFTHCGSRVIDLVAREIPDSTNYQLLETTFDKCTAMLDLEHWGMALAKIAASSPIPRSLITKILAIDRKQDIKTYGYSLTHLKQAIYDGYLRHLSETELLAFLENDQISFILKEAIVLWSDRQKKLSSSEAQEYSDLIKRFRASEKPILRALAVSSIEENQENAVPYLRQALQDESPEVSGKAVEKLADFIPFWIYSRFGGSESEQVTLDLLESIPEDADIRVLGLSIIAWHHWAKRYHKLPEKFCNYRKHENPLISLPAKYYVNKTAILSFPEFSLSCDPAQGDDMADLIGVLQGKKASVKIVSEGDTSDFLLQVHFDCPSIHNTRPCGITQILAKGNRKSLSNLSIPWFAGLPKAWLYHPDYMTTFLVGDCHCSLPLIDWVEFQTAEPISWEEYLAYWDQVFLQQPLELVSLKPVNAQTKGYFEEIEKVYFQKVTPNAEQRARYQATKAALQALEAKRRKLNI